MSPDTKNIANNLTTDPYTAQIDQLVVQLDGKKARVSFRSLWPHCNRKRSKETQLPTEEQLCSFKNCIELLCLFKINFDHKAVILSRLVFSQTTKRSIFSVVAFT